MIELITKKNIFLSEGSNKDQSLLEQMQEKLGFIEDEWPEFKSVTRDYFNTQLKFQKQDNFKRSLKQYLLNLHKSFDEHALDLIDKILVYDPSKRLSAEQCLSHSFFSQNP